MASDVYPKRPPFFALKYTRLMAKCCLANELGPEVFCLLTVIAGVEDSKSYRSPVTYWNEQLMPIAGFKSVDTLARARNKAMVAGWLHYEPGSRTTPARYWVTIPNEFLVMDDMPTDENMDEYTPRTTADLRNFARSSHGDGAEFARSERGQHAEPSSLILSLPKKEEEDTSGEVEKPKAKPKQHPESVPIPPSLASDSFSKIWTEWIEFRREIKKPMSERSARHMLESLLPLSRDSAVECVRASIANGWQGLFPEKFTGKPAGRPPPAVTRHSGYDVPPLPPPPIPASLLS